MAPPITWRANSLGRYSVFMLDNSFTTVIISIFLGFLSGVGVGGGSLLILWLTLVLGMDHRTARVLNLLFFIPSALVSSLFRWKQNTLNFPKILPAVIAGCISAGLFALLSKQMDIHLLRKFFGVLLLVTGLRELFYKEKDQRIRKAR